jgi:rod shape-determining protein MreC
MNGAKNFSISAGWRKKNKFSLKFFIGAFILLLVLVILNLFILPIKNSFYFLSSPAQKIFWSAGESSSGFLGSIFNAGNLSKQNQNLKNEVEKLQVKIASLQSVISGNQAQSSVSFACQNNDFNLLMAGVIGLQEHDMLSVNKGYEDGIKEGMPVINQQGALFGKVFKVYKNFSEVMLISNKDSVVAVEVQKDDKEIGGILRGEGNLNVYLDLVSIDDTINENDILVTSSLENTFPKNLLVGTIIKVEKNDQDPHQRAKVKPALNSSENNLFVILNYKNR